ncbi:hypothetical protein [Absidia glauca]|uniref:Uncharacterized protein n=1 Tax=Absidia glauca TaxID=4829 RepID=A0A163K686_ABSGL|nr:hypothetical protein [Absidia glauca]
MPFNDERTKTPNSLDTQVSTSSSSMTPIYQWKANRSSEKQTVRTFELALDDLMEYRLQQETKMGLEVRRLTAMMACNEMDTNCQVNVMQNCDIMDRWCVWAKQKTSKDTFKG